MIRQIMPDLIAQEIMSVQPMTGPVGLIYNLRFGDNERTLHRNKERIVSDMIIVHTAVRPFMRSGDLEPNEHYRPWLEEHVGEQGINWNWEIHSTNPDQVAIHFENTEHATLFEITWQ
jgi:hypothetical protein